VWSSARLFSIVLYTCKGFDTARAIDFTRELFVAEVVESMEF
jgi:S-adenosylmethionine decarboxylase